MENNIWHYILIWVTITLNHADQNINALISPKNVNENFLGDYETQELNQAFLKHDE